MHFTTSPAELQLSGPAAQRYEVLADTSARPAIGAANVGGNFGMDVVTNPGASSDPSVIDFSGRASSFPAVGQVPIFPDLLVQISASAPTGFVEAVTVQVDALHAPSKALVL